MASSSDEETPSLNSSSPRQRYRALYAKFEQWAKSAVYDPYEEYSIPKQPGRTRVCVMRFPHEQPTEIEHFQSSDSLYEYLSQGQASADNAMPRRQIVLIENPGPQYVEALGASLGVPPHYFVLQQSQIDNTAIADQDCMGHDLAQYWRVAVPQIHHGMMRQPSANRKVFYLEPASDGRVVWVFPERKWHVSTHPVSFWASEENGTWTAVLAVDPTFKHAYDFESSERIDLQNKVLPYALHISMSPLKSGHLGHPQQEEIGERTLSNNSIFDRLVEMYRNYPLVVTRDPKSAAKFCGAVVCSMYRIASTMYIENSAQVWSRDWVIEEPQVAPDGRMFAHRKWEGERYAQLIQFMDDIKLLRHNFQYAAYVFGIDPVDRRMTDRESMTWYNTNQVLLFLKDEVESMIATYVQRGAVEQSVIANEQARSIGRLTVLASILVPFSVVAGIFSMNGNFAAGEDLFYVFWVVVIPISAGLILWAFSVRIKAVAISEGVAGLLRICGELLYRVLKAPFCLAVWFFGRLKRRYRRWRSSQSHASEPSTYSLDSV